MKEAKYLPVLSPIGNNPAPIDRCTLAIEGMWKISIYKRTLVRDDENEREEQKVTISSLVKAGTAIKASPFDNLRSDILLKAIALISIDHSGDNGVGDLGLGTEVAGVRVIEGVKVGGKKKWTLLSLPCLSKSFVSDEVVLSSYRTVKPT